MHLTYNTTVCFRSVSKETGRITWKRVLCGDKFATLILGAGVLFQTGEVDSRIAQSMTLRTLDAGVTDVPCGKPFSDSITMHCMTVTLLDERGLYDPTPMPYLHTIIDMTGVMRRIRCRRACLILVAKLREPRGRDAAVSIAKIVWTTRFNQEWDRE